jgi:hypothetical protein
VTEHSRNAQAAETIADLRALMAELRDNVDQLNAILAVPEASDGNVPA